MRVAEVLDGGWMDGWMDGEGGMQWALVENLPEAGAMDGLQQ